jgi:hypothetical protein
MSWVAVGVAAVGATSSYMNNKAKQKHEEDAMKANAEAMRYSPWTGMKPQMMGKTSGSDIAAIMQGGVGGAMMGSQFRGAGGGSGETPVTPDAGGNSPLGGNEMAGQLGAQGSNFQKSMAPMPAEQVAQQPLPQLQQPAMGGYSQPGSPWSPLAQKKPSMYGTY